jgi:mannose-6-phosphate isomerase-like protein (cupin superfamily)
MSGGTFDNRPDITAGAPVRRVVTGNNSLGKSYFVSDGLVPRGVFWTTSLDDPQGGGPDAPSPLLPSTAPHIEPPPGGSSTVLISLPPWKEIEPRLARGEIPGHDAGGFHRTATVDYLYLVSGELELLLDEGALTLHAGDVIIQRNARHSWRNHGDKPVSFIATMIPIAK